MYAVVSTGGKQHKVTEGEFLAVEKLDAQVGDTVTLQPLMLVDGDKIVMDEAGLAKVKVEAKVVNQFLGEKLVIFKFKKRKGYKRTRGHRQNLTQLQITKIAATKPRAAKPKAEAPAAEAVAAE